MLCPHILRFKVLPTRKAFCISANRVPLRRTPRRCRAFSCTLRLFCRYAATDSARITLGTPGLLRDRRHRGRSRVDLRLRGRRSGRGGLSRPGCIHSREQGPQARGAPHTQAQRVSRIIAASTGIWSPWHRQPRRQQQRIFAPRVPLWVSKMRRPAAVQPSPVLVSARLECRGTGLTVASVWTCLSDWYVIGT